jgi:ATP-dependent Clp protease protease subunit
MATTSTANEKRLLMLGETVTNQSVNSLIKAITEYNMQDDAILENELINKEKFERQPIILLVNCYGGVVYDGWALIAAMEMSTTPIITVAVGSVMSMALPIFLAGHIRLAQRQATFMYHEISGGAGGFLTEIKEYADQAGILQDRYDEYVLEKTSITKEKLMSVREKKKNWFIRADEAKKLGITEEVIVEPFTWALEYE